MIANINKLIDMQKQLMAEVPHTVRPDVYPKMLVVVGIINNLLLYLGSCGHKPWRPQPLDMVTQDKYITAARESMDALLSMHIHGVKIYHRQTVPPIFSRQLISVLGIIEESVEFVSEVEKHTPGLATQLEELTDILFFYLESMILGGFSWAEVEEEYVRKHAINMERYRRAKQNDYLWDDRSKKEGL